VERFAIALVREHDPQYLVRDVGTHQDGRLDVTPAPAPGTVCRVIPEAEDLACAEVRLEAGELPTSVVRVRLESCAPLRVRVVGRDGAPRAGVSVRAAAARPRHERRGTGPPLPVGDVRQRRARVLPRRHRARDAVLAR
jgi:hypothetical protein